MAKRQISCQMAQRKEIEKYQKHLSKKLNREVSRNEAAFEWISKYAARWREQFNKKSCK